MSVLIEKLGEEAAKWIGPVLEYYALTSEADPVSAELLDQICKYIDHKKAGEIMAGLTALSMEQRRKVAGEFLGRSRRRHQRFYGKPACVMSEIARQAEEIARSEKVIEWNSTRNMAKSDA